MIEGITREEPEDYKKHKQHLLEAQSSRKTEDSVHFSYNEDELKKILHTLHLNSERLAYTAVLVCDPGYGFGFMVNSNKTLHTTGKTEKNAGSKKR